MATIMPQSELCRKAIALADELLAQGADRTKALEEAAMRFNLGPKDVEFLERFFEQRT